MGLMELAFRTVISKKPFQFPMLWIFSVSKKPILLYLKTVIFNLLLAKRKCIVFCKHVLAVVKKILHIICVWKISLMLYQYRKENHGESVLVDQRKDAWVSPNLGHTHKICSVWTPISVKIWFALHWRCISVIYQFRENTGTDHFLH